MANKFTLKIAQVDTDHTTKFNMTVGEIYQRKNGAAGYAIGNKDNYESREDATETVKDLLREFFSANGFNVEFTKED